MRVLFRDLDPDVATALALAFATQPLVDVLCEDIFATRAADAIVSPANSHGWMDGGINLAYIQRFGDDLERRLRLMIRQDHAGLLPVGHALASKTDAVDIPWMISAPTMERRLGVPRSLKAYKEFRLRCCWHGSMV